MNIESKKVKNLYASFTLCKISYFHIIFCLSLDFFIIFIVYWMSLSVTQLSPLSLLSGDDDGELIFAHEIRCFSSETDPRSAQKGLY